MSGPNGDILSHVNNLANAMFGASIYHPSELRSAVAALKEQGSP